MVNTTANRTAPTTILAKVSTAFQRAAAVEKTRGE